MTNKVVPEDFIKAFGEGAKQRENVKPNEPNNDLISREALKKAIMSKRPTNIPSNDIMLAIHCIDNAPTVEPRIEYGTDGQPYKLSMTNGKEYERPQVEKKPVFKSVPTYRKYEDYHDAEQYVRGWNDAMRFIFGIEEK